MDEVCDIAVRKDVELVIMSTAEAIKHISDPRAKSFYINFLFLSHQSV